MLKNLLFAGAILFSLLAGAQKPSMKFGKIDPAILSMPRYEADTSAGALILGDIGDITITYNDFTGFQVEFRRHIRFKVFNSTGFDLANFKLPYYYSGEQHEKFISIKAVSYNLDADNKIVKTELEKSNIFTEELSTKEMSRNFSVPNVKNGTVFEVEYALNSDLFWSIRDWDFQSTVPTLFSELCITLPEYFIYKTLLKGYISPTTSSSKSVPGRLVVKNSNGTEEIISYYCEERKIRFENVPAFREEPYMNALSNYLTSIEFELAAINFPFSKKDYTTTWEKISTNLWTDVDFGAQLKRNCPIKEEAEKLKTDYADPKERMQKAFELIRNSMAFNDRYGIYITKTLRKAWDEKKGKAADINLLMISLLNEIGIEAEPVILSTRSNGFLHPAQIMLGKFNYVIAEARIGDESFLLDATDKRLPYNLLPERCLNGEGRRISQTETLNQWIPLLGNQENERVLYAQTLLAPSGNMSGDFSMMETNYFADSRAKEIRKENSNDDYTNSYEAETPGLSISVFNIENLDDRSLPLYLKYKANYNVSDDSPKDIIYVNPTLGAGINSNPFISENREFPVDFTIPWSSKIIHMITIPEGYTVAELPKSALINLPEQLGSFKYTIVATGNQIQLMSVIRIKEHQIVSTNYPDIRELFSRIVAKQAEMIVLKKI